MTFELFFNWMINPPRCKTNLLTDVSTKLFLVLAKHCWIIKKIYSEVMSMRWLKLLVLWVLTRKKKSPFPQNYNNNDRFWTKFYGCVLSSPIWGGLRYYIFMWKHLTKLCVGKVSAFDVCTISRRNVEIVSDC